MTEFLNSLSLFLLIVLTKTAKNKMADLGWSAEELAGELDSLGGHVRLYKWKGPSKKDGQITIALPVKGGAGALSLKRDKDGKNYFCCTHVEKFGSPVPLSAAGNMCHNLDTSARVKIVEDMKVRRYLRDALDCDLIEQEAEDKKLWKPWVGGGVEDRKWGAYLRLHKAACEKRQMVGLPAEVVAVDDGKMTAKLKLSDMTPEVDEKEIEEKVRGSKGELFEFNLLPLTGEAGGRKSPKLGELSNSKKVDGDLQLTFRLDSGFCKSLESEVCAGKFYAEDTRPPDDRTSVLADAPISLEPGTNELPDSAQMLKFYSPGAYSPGAIWTPAFSCRAAEMDGGGGVWMFAPGSVTPSRLYLHANFVGELFQIRVMEHGLRQIWKLPIGKVLTEDRVAKLPDEEGDDVEFADDCRLNPGQKEAVRKALRAKELLLIWGPPGTGKTEVIAEIARQEAKRGGKTLIASQANLAVDNAVARLHDSPNVWPLRIAKDDWDPEKDDKGKVPMRNTAGEFFLKRLMRRLRESRGDDAREGVAALRKEFGKRLGELRKRDGDSKQARDSRQMAELYRCRLNVVGATLMESGKTEKGEGRGKKERPHSPYKLFHTTGIGKFSTVIVDEVSKAMPPELFLPVPLGGRLILVGDHRQLPPVIKDPVSGEERSLEEWAKEAGVPKEELKLEPTLFECLWEKHKDDHMGDVRAMLTTQYRMHTDIQKLIEPFYMDSEGKLECGLNEDELRKLSVAQSGFFANHVAWIRAGNGANDQESKEGTSFLNRTEIRIVGALLEALPAGRKGMSVGVITFYGAQLRALCGKYDNGKFRNKFPGGLFFGTVDRFQGRECDVIICSLVRNNKHGNIGFASKPNRINVAFSRARALLCIVGSEDTFCYGKKGRASEIYKSVYHACERTNGCVSESELLGNFGLDALQRKWGGHAR